MLKLFVAAGSTPFAAMTVTGNVPALPGNHAMTPFVAWMLIPAGAAVRLNVGSGFPFAFAS